MSLGRPRKAFIAKPYSLVVSVLHAVWICVITYNEIGTFHGHISKCPWPDSGLELPSSADPSSSQRPAHIMILADPQILDARSYPGRSPWLMWLSQLMVDLNLRKSWRVALSLKPDAVIFLGDMMDGGRAAVSDEEYEEYYQRFRRIFRPNLTDPLPMYFLPGNHDIGLGASPRFSDRAVARYTSHFGPLNQLLDLGHDTFVLIDAPGLVEEEDRRSRSGLSYAHWAAQESSGTIGFVDSFGSRQHHQPPILFTHIPLARPDGASCGPLRERGTIRKGFGHGYQNTLAPHTSQFLLQSTRPAIIFSGDDHDYCEYVHTYSASEDPSASFNSVKEVTVKSFSMAMGVREPGFQLLSLSPSPSPSPSSGDTLATIPCLLPDQLGIYLSVYLPLLILTLLALLLSNAHRVRTRGRFWAEVALPEWCQRLRCSRTVVLGGRRIRIAFPLRERRDSEEDEEKLTASKGEKRLARARAGLVSGWARDLLSVAWVPLVWFAGISWWVS